MPHVTLPKVGTDKAWRDAARACLAARLPPSQIIWSRGTAEDIRWDEGEAPAPARPGPIRVPERFVALAGQVVWHREPERFARLYGFLWRLRTAPGLMAEEGDRDLVALRQMERAVARDVHRLKGAVRFLEIGERDAPRRSFAAWTEPAHRTLEPAAPFFARRFAEMDVAVVTPDLILRCEGGAVRFLEGPERPDLPGEGAEEAWRDWLRAALDPAGEGMLAERPRAWWKDQPEAALAPDLLAEVAPRPRAAVSAPFYAKALASRPAAARPGPAAAPAHLLALKEEEDACTRCPLHAGASQAVPGEGPLGAALMLVGEGPGDGDDLSGRPFAGPSGQLLEQLLAEVGIDRGTVFLTNAVKHVKVAIKGGRRVHQPPNGGEIAACRPWLHRELSLVGPRLVVAMGASAAESLTGTGEGVLKRRGTIEEGPGGVPVLLTVHPSFLLRLPDPVAKELETERFRQDLRAAREHLDGLPAE